MLKHSHKLPVTLSVLVVLLFCVVLTAVARGPYTWTKSSSTSSSTSTTTTVALPVLQNPPSGSLYHGAYVSSWGGEDKLTQDEITSYQAQAGKQAAWIYFTHEWANGRAFPLTNVNLATQNGSVPFIRIMLRNNPAGQAVSTSTTDWSLAAINKGNFDQDFIAWGNAARQYGKPLLVEFGTEVNGAWFPWNGYWNGADTPLDAAHPDIATGPYVFKQAFRRIVTLVRGQGATNIKWVFHVNYVDYPDVAWNHLENYYPGDDVVDYLATSVYGVQKPTDTYWDEFTPLMDRVYNRLASLANKPVIVAEWAVAKNNPGGLQEDWADHALTNLLANRWPRVIGFSWFNNHWQNDQDPAHNTYMMLEENPVLAITFQKNIKNSTKVLGRPISSK